MTTMRSFFPRSLAGWDHDPAQASDAVTRRQKLLATDGLSLLEGAEAQED